MINDSLDTVLEPDDTLRTIRDAEDDGRREKVLLNSGQTFFSDYIIIDRLDASGAQSTIYTARRDGRQYAVKIYDRGHNPPTEFTKALIDHACPYVATLREFGHEEGVYFEIYDYYSKGTLEDKGKCTLPFIKDIVVPNLNEGLHFLHTLKGTGIVHGDIKPSNIFVSNDESHVLIGDFGISAYLDSRGHFIDDIKGTPEYAPMTGGHFGKVRKSPAYDYASFGLVLVRLATGHSLLGGLIIGQMMEMWSEGMHNFIPDSIDSQLKRLIAGLLRSDENERFGYSDVDRWLRGEYISLDSHAPYTRSRIAKPKGEPYIFGFFDDRIIVVETLDQLAEAIAENWEHTKNHLTREAFFKFFSQFDGKDKDLENDMRHFALLPNKDEAIFKMLCRIKKDGKIIFKGQNYGNLNQFMQAIDQEMTEDIRTILFNGLFEFYLRQNNYPEEQIDKTVQMLSMENRESRVVPQLLFCMFNPQREIHIADCTLTSMDELIDLAVTLSPDAIGQLANDNRLLAWLYNNGYEKEVLELVSLEDGRIS